MIDTVYPTRFAISIAEKSGIVPAHKNRGNLMPKQREEYRERMESLQHFQQMSLTASAEDALIAFHGFELSDEQITILSVIHKHTTTYALGHATSVLQNKLEEKMLSGKDAKEIALAMVEIIAKTSPNTEENKKQQNGGYNVFLSGKIEENA